LNEPSKLKTALPFGVTEAVSLTVGLQAQPQLQPLLQVCHGQKQLAQQLCVPACHENQR
jgi:hypothetical protein